MKNLIYKRSFYTELTDQIDINDTESGRLLYATRTGSLLLIKEDSYYDYIANNFENIPEDLFQMLVEAEAIVPSEDNELHTVLFENKKAISKSGILDIVIQPGASCQLGCHYCGQQHTKDYMSEETRNNLINRIRSKIIESKCNKLSVVWYGAEPLMALNQIYTIGTDILNLVQEMGIEYQAAMVTNGLSLKNEIFKTLSRDFQITTFQVTLDGVAKYHDRNRYLKKDKGPSFSIIFNNLLSIVIDPTYLENPARIQLRCNVDTNNVEGLPELIDLLDANKFQDKVYFYLVPIHNWGDNGVEDSTGVEKDDFSVQEIDWMMDLIKRGFNTNVLPERLKITCSAVKPQSEVYDAYGNISTCWEVPYTPLFTKTPFEIGHLNSPLVDEPEDVPLRNWNDDIKDGKSMSPCAKCTLLPVCGGSCPIHWISGTAACPSYRFNIKDRMVLEYLNRKHLIN